MRRPTTCFRRTPGVRSFALAAALLLGAAALPGNVFAGNLMTRVDGSFAGGGSFDGSVTLDRFEAQGDRLVAVGTLDGALTDAAGETVGQVRRQAVRLAVAPGSLAASCDLLSARLGPATVEAGGQRVELAAIELEISARSARGDSLRRVLCALAERVAAGAPSNVLAPELDRVLATLG